MCLSREGGGDGQILFHVGNNVSPVADGDDIPIYKQLIQIISAGGCDLNGDGRVVVHGAAALDIGIFCTIYSAGDGDGTVCAGVDGNNGGYCAGGESGKGGIAARIGEGHTGLNHGAAAAGEGGNPLIGHLAGADGGDNAPLHQVAAVQTECCAVFQNGYRGELCTASRYGKRLGLLDFASALIDGQAFHLAQCRIDQRNGAHGFISRRIGGGEGKGVAGRRGV